MSSYSITPAWLKGLTIQSISGLAQESEQLDIVFTNGVTLRMYHNQDCCESVSLNDYETTCAQDKLIGATVLDLREEFGVDEGAANGYAESYTWTFYHINTDKGSLWLRWYGESNGYYSESVDMDVVLTTRDHYIWYAAFLKPEDQFDFLSVRGAA